MKKRLFSLFFALLLCFVLAGCGENKDTTKTTQSHKYQPDKSGDSYYSIKDEAPLRVKTQKAGTCWTNAITSSMEGSYYKKYREEISFDATDLCLQIYDDEKAEGWFCHRDKLDYGGWDWMACDYLPNGYAGCFLHDAWRYDIEGARDAMKQGIRNNGPISIALCDSTTYKREFDGYFTMNDDNPDHMDHAVVIIGWDDHFPKDYFKNPAKEDGAWLCQNSKSENWGNEGTYWVSYESLIDENVIFSMSDEYSDIAFYDYGNEKQISTGDTTSLANVFSKEGKLAAIGTYTNADNQKYKIEIFDGTFGKLLCSVDGPADIKGYHVVDLPESIDVKKFTVVVTYEGLAAVEGESYDVDDSAVSYVAKSQKGQSFVLLDGEWIDLADDDIEKKLGIDFKPNNACIKALYK
ncbi:MAG: lectin like domain-containing protein [Lachnospiraceae bacterium]|nr:lectin like domain-containing protein [Lachnospiraceae bacterium]